MIQIDMQIPKSCRFCPLHDVDTEQCPLCTINKDDYAQSRYEFCPLQEVATDEDTVSRKQAINEIRNTFRVLYSGDMISKADAVDILNELPPSPSPSQSRPQIPCKNCTWSDKCKQILHEFCPHEAILKESMKGRTHE